MSELYQSLVHSKWDCKYHVVFVPKRRRKAIFGNIRRQLGAVFHALAQQKRVPDSRRASDAGPCAHVHCHTPEASGRLGDWVSQGEERHCHRSDGRKRKELFRRAFLGTWLCGVHGWLRTGAGPQIHPRAGTRGWSTRTVLNRH